jgi:hypothetical protein
LIETVGVELLNWVTDWERFLDGQGFYDGFFNGVPGKEPSIDSSQFQDTRRPNKI